MSGLEVGDQFPSGVIFTYCPPTPETEDLTACGRPIKYETSKEFAGKKVVLFSVPGAFTPACAENHLPGYIQALPELKKKGVDIVAVIAYNDAWVMSAWRKANKVEGNDILFLCDDGRKFSQSIGWTSGDRNARYAIVIENGAVTYAGKESGPGVTVSGAEAVLAKL